MFGVDTEKLNFYNGASNLLDAYFDTKENNQSLSTDVYTKLLKNKNANM